jgi:hypothetical protein
MTPSLPRTVQSVERAGRVFCGRVLPAVILVLGACAHLAATPALAAAQPGEQVRNAFGPATGTGATLCRGACGVGCPSSCRSELLYECVESAGLLPVNVHRCGTHLGCREHDDCLDQCTLRAARGIDCQTKCHSEALEAHGFEYATSWATGGGPFDGDPIVFEYTRRGPEAPEPTYRCPDGARRECAGDSGRCVDSAGAVVEPVFDAYADSGSGAMRISGFRAGRWCGDGVCGQSADIEVSGEDSCPGSQGPAACTRFAMEFDYRDADPAMPLECSVSTEGGDGDFIGDLIKKGFDSAPQLGGDSFEGNRGLGEFLGVLQKAVQSADSPEDVEISMAPLGPDGQPIESQRVGSGPREGPRPIPRSVDLPAASGHLVVPMYQRAGDSTPGSTVVREIRCSHRGVPVLETTFRFRH